MAVPRIKRIENDKYFTEDRLTDALLKRIDLRGRILECCAGDRAIARRIHNKVATHSGSVVLSSDLTDSETSEFPLLHADQTTDATTREFWENYNRPGTQVLNWVVTNPPFNVAPKIIPLAYKNSRVGIAMLLRLSYLEPCANRAAWLQSNADNLKLVMPVNPRPRFRADTKGTDSCTVAWFVWDKQHSWKSLGVDCPFVFAAGWR